MSDTRSIDNTPKSNMDAFGMSQSSLKKTASAAERVAQAIRRRIVTGASKPGSFLPTLGRLAKEFRASRTTVLDAITLLTAEGLTEAVPGRGTRVVPSSERFPKKVVGLVYAEEIYRDIHMDGVHILDATRNALSERERHYVPVPLKQIKTCANSHVEATTDELAGTCDGLLFIETFGYQDVILGLQARGVPVVVANIELDLDVSATWVDHEKVTRSAALMLAALGHQRIALVTRPADKYFYGKATEGYKAGLEEAGLDFDESLVAVAERTEALAAYLATKPLFADPAPPTAVVAARDVLAGGVCQVISEQGMVMGRDVSVIGFDDLSWPHERGCFATFREPCEELSVAAVDMLLERMSSGQKPLEKREIQAPFILRPSIGPPPQIDGARVASQEFAWPIV